jgi:hypothetical protein
MHIHSTEKRSRIRLRNINIQGGKEGGIVLKDADLIIGKGVTITGNKPYGVCVDSGGNLVMEGGEVSNNKGCGVYMTANADFEMRDGIITNNRLCEGSKLGGAVNIYGRCSRFSMLGGIIERNEGRAGGGVFLSPEGVEGHAEWDEYKNWIESVNKDKPIPWKDDGGSVFEMSGGRIAGNLAYDGGGVGIESPCVMKMSGGIIIGNIARRDGGALLTRNQNVMPVLPDIPTDEPIRSKVIYPPAFEMTGGYIAGNSAARGGGIASYAGDNENHAPGVVLSGGRIIGNLSREGGGLYVAYGYSEIRGKTVINDNSAGYGGGLYVGSTGGLSAGMCRVLLTENAVISGNIAENNGSDLGWGGGVCVADEFFDMEGGRIEGNQAVKGGGLFVACEDENVRIEDGPNSPRSFVHNPAFSIFTKTAGTIEHNSPDDFQHTPSNKKWQRD